MLSYLRMCLGQIANVLDVGCGTGTMLTTFAKHQPDWSFVGIDPAESMIEFARNKISTMNFAERITLNQGTIEILPNEPNLDAATTVLVEQLLPDDGSKLNFLKEIHHRIKPGGWFILASLKGDLRSAIAQNALNAWVNFIALQGLPKPAQEGVRQRTINDSFIVSEERLKELVRKAGFNKVERIYDVQLIGGWLAQKI